MYADHRRVQRREFKDYQPLFMLINSLDIIDDATRRDFMCINGPVWLRFNEATKGAKERRITTLFLSNENNTFDELLFVGCDYVRRRQRHCRVLWRNPALCPPPSEHGLRHVCLELAGRSILTVKGLRPYMAILDSDTGAEHPSVGSLGTSTMDHLHAHPLSLQLQPVVD